MPLEARNSAGAALGSLSGCLVEGDPEQRAREKRVRRRSLTLSLLLQALVLAALLIVPLFGKAERLISVTWMPEPIFAPGGHDSSPVHSAAQRQRPRHTFTAECRFCAPRRIPTQIIERTDDGQPPIEGSLPPGIGTGNQNIIGAIPGIDTGGNRTPPPPLMPSTTKRIRVTTLEAAMLLHRVEPVFPPLLRQLRRGGRVELRAVIATDGTIQSLQIIGGDPMCYQSAVDAVKQWHYRPTILNGVPVEVETHITVIYQIQ